MARQGRKGGGSHGLIASLWSSVQKRSYFSLSDRRAFFMFFPEELITYAVYSNPADFCQGKKTPERWLQLVLFREGGCLVKNGSKALKPRPWLRQGPLDVIGCVSVSMGGWGRRVLLCTYYGPLRGKKKYLCRAELAHIHVDTHHIHRGFVHLNMHAKPLVSLPNYSAVSRDLSDISACCIWELGVKLEKLHSKWTLKNNQLPATLCMSGLTQKHDWQYEPKSSCSDADSTVTVSFSGAKLPLRDHYFS